jgi:hypothetical protein
VDADSHSADERMDGADPVKRFDRIVQGSEFVRGCFHHVAASVMPGAYENSVAAADAGNLSQVCRRVGHAPKLP